MYHTADAWYTTHKKALVYLCSPNATLEEQIRTAFNGTGCRFKLIDGLLPDIDAAVKGTLCMGFTPILFFTNVGFQNGGFSTQTKNMLRLFDSYRTKGYQQLALFDELDKQITHLTGGMNAHYYHSATDMQKYDKIRRQTVSLNLFDELRAAGVRVMGFSGTLNNTICSKLASTGYHPRDTCIYNAYPIEELYSKLTCVPMDTSSIPVMDAHLRTAEATGKHILVVFSKKKQINKFIEDYARFYKKPLAFTRIDSDSAPPTAGTFRQYILGVNMLTTGFDLATWMPGGQFCMGILVRDLSDKGSQPLSSNPSHELYHPESALLQQTLLRLRDGGIFLTPERVGEVDIIEAVRRVSTIIKAGYHEFAKYGDLVCPTQPSRWNRSVLVSICQNLREGGNTPTLTEVLILLNSYSGGRDLAAELKRGAFDIPYWSDAVGLLWEVFWADSKHCTKDRESYKAALVREFTMRMRGGGARKPRLTNDEIRATVLERSKGLCCHCGELIDLVKQRQLAHIRRHDDDGAFALDNLCVAHEDCDKVFDSGNVIYAKDGSALYSKPRFTSFAPDVSQLRHASPANLEARWSWAKTFWESSTLSDADFETRMLHDLGFTKKAL